MSDYRDMVKSVEAWLKTDQMHYFVIGVDQAFNSSETAVMVFPTMEILGPTDVDRAVGFVPMSGTVVTERTTTTWPAGSFPRSAMR